MRPLVQRWIADAEFPDLTTGPASLYIPIYTKYLKIP